MMMMFLFYQMPIKPAIIVIIHSSDGTALDK